MIGIAGGVSGALHVVGNLLDGCGHLGDRGGRLVGLAALAVEHLRLGIGQTGRLRRPRLDPDAGIHQTGQGCLQASLFTDDGQVQLPLQTRVVAVGQGHQRAGERLGVLGQGPANGLVLPVFDPVPGPSMLAISTPSAAYCGNQR